MAVLLYIKRLRRIQSNPINVKREYQIFKTLIIVIVTMVTAALLFLVVFLGLCAS